MLKKPINSNFLKLLFTLIFILIIEFILIYRGYKQNSSKIYDLNTKNCVAKKSIGISASGSINILQDDNIKTIHSIIVRKASILS